MIYFEDEEIIIRDIVEEDAVSLFAWWTDKEQNRHDPRPLPANSKELLKECQSYCQRFEAEIINPNVEERKYLYFIITDKNNQPIGSVNFFSVNREKKQGEMGVGIGDKRYWRKGVASRAIDAATAYIFNNMDIERIYIETGEANIPALKLFAKSGFLRCGEYMDEDFKFIVMEKTI